MTKLDPVMSDMANFFKDKKVLIAEPSSSFALAIQQILLKLGSTNENIVKEGDFAKAELYLREKPQIIISEYHIGNRFGLELATAQAKLIEDASQRIFILATGNSNDSTVAEAAEEEIDGYILKPFTLKQFQDVLTGIIYKKMKPSKYSLKIQQGKTELAAQKFEGAVNVFHEAKTLDQKPALACYYQGYSNKELKFLDEALKNFTEGRLHNALHYKCLHGEFDILFAQNRRSEAYDVLKVINGNFPVSPSSLEKMFMLAILTNNYKDLDSYYQSFLNLDRRSDKLIKVVSEALFFAARFHLKDKETKAAMDLFNKATVVAKRQPGFLNKIVQVLLKDNLVKEAEEIMTLFTPDTRDTTDYLIADFEISRKVLKSHEVIAKGKKLIDVGRATPEICKAVISLLATEGRETALDQTMYKAAQLFPNLKQEFYAFNKAE